MSSAQPVSVVGFHPSTSIHPHSHTVGNLSVNTGSMHVTASGAAFNVSGGGVSTTEGVSIDTGGTLSMGTDTYTQADLATMLAPSSLLAGDSKVEVVDTGSGEVKTTVDGSVVTTVDAEGLSVSGGNKISSSWINQDGWQSITGNFTSNYLLDITVPFTKLDAIRTFQLAFEYQGCAGNGSSRTYRKIVYTPHSLHNSDYIPEILSVCELNPYDAGLYAWFDLDSGTAGNLRIELNPYNGYVAAGPDPSQQPIMGTFKVSVNVVPGQITFGAATIVDTGSDAAVSGSNPYNTALIGNIVTELDVLGEVAAKSATVDAVSADSIITVKSSGASESKVSLKSSANEVGRFLMDTNDDVHLETVFGNKSLLLASHGTGGLSLSQGATQFIQGTTGLTHVSFNGSYILKGDGTNNIINDPAGKTAVDSSTATLVLSRDGFEVFNAAATTTDVKVNGTTVQEMEVGSLTLTGHCFPKTHQAYDLGSSSFEWRYIYSQFVLQVSDGRFKENIVDIPDALSTINKLRPKRYNQTGNKVFNYGFIAQEVEQLEESTGWGAVHYDEKTDKYGLAYSEFIALNTQAIQQLSAKVERLEALLGVSGGPGSCGLGSSQKKRKANE